MNVYLFFLPQQDRRRNLEMEYLHCAKCKELFSVSILMGCSSYSRFCPSCARSQHFQDLTTKIPAQLVYNGDINTVGTHLQCSMVLHIKCSFCGQEVPRVYYDTHTETCSLFQFQAQIFAKGIQETNKFASGVLVYTSEMRASGKSSMASEIICPTIAYSAEPLREYTSQFQTELSDTVKETRMKNDSDVLVAENVSLSSRPFRTIEKEDLRGLEVLKEQLEFVDHSTTLYIIEIENLRKQVSSIRAKLVYLDFQLSLIKRRNNNGAKHVIQKMPQFRKQKSDDASTSSGRL